MKYCYKLKDPMMNFETIFKNNQQWVVEPLATNPEHFTNLAKGLHPEFFIHRLQRQSRDSRRSYGFKAEKCSFTGMLPTWSSALTIILGP